MAQKDTHELLSSCNKILSAYQDIEDALREIKDLPGKLDLATKSLLDVVRSSNNIIGKTITQILPG